MSVQRRQFRLNRAVFANRPLDSRALTVLASLFHRFTEPGDYEVFVHRDGPLARRLTVRVGAEGGAFQHNLDLAAADAAGPDRACGADYVLNTGGVLGFFVSSGSASYTVRVSQLGAREKRTWLESDAAIPAGDLFAVTLVRPGLYRAYDELNRAEAAIRVEMPEAPQREDTGKGEADADPRQSARDPRQQASRYGPADAPGDPGQITRVRQPRPRPANRYRPDTPTLLELGKGGFSEKETRILAGQTAVFHCLIPAQIRVELVEPAQPAGKPGARQRYTLRRG